MTKPLLRSACALMAISLTTLGTLHRARAESARQQQRAVEAQKGDIANGIVGLEDQKQLRLNTDPCNAKSDVVIFYPPYTKTKVGPVKCGDAVLERYQVEKK